MFHFRFSISIFHFPFFIFQFHISISFFNFIFQFHFSISFFIFIFNFSFFIFVGETIEAGQENSIIKRKEELLVIEKALKSSTGNLKNALKDVEGFFMTENDKKLGPLKLKLKVSTIISFYFFHFLFFNISFYLLVFYFLFFILYSLFFIFCFLLHVTHLFSIFYLTLFF